MAAQIFKKFLQKILTNLWLKSASLALAIIIWFFIISQGRTDKTFRDIPLEIRNIPSNYVITNLGADFVKVTMRGPQNLVTLLRPESISVSVDLPDNVEPGDVNLSLTTKDVKVPYPNQISILQISPTELSIHLEKTTTKIVPIRPFIRGSPASPYEVGNWAVVPSEAQIKGPEDILENTSDISTEAIDVTGVDLTFNERVEVQPQNNLIRVVSPMRVTVTIEIKEKIIERSFPEFEFRVLSTIPNQAIPVNPPAVTLIVSGPQRILASLQPKDIELIADCRTLEPGIHNIPLIIVSSPMDQVSFLIDPAEVEVNVPTPLPEQPSTPGGKPG